MSEIDETLTSLEDDLEFANADGPSEEQAGSLNGSLVAADVALSESDSPAASDAFTLDDLLDDFPDPPADILSPASDAALSFEDLGLDEATAAENLAERAESAVAATEVRSATQSHEASAASLDDPVRMYLREIGRVSLLTGEREVELAKAMERGEYLRALRLKLRSESGSAASAEAIGLEIYRAFRDGWSHVSGLLGAVGEYEYPEREHCLKRVLPLTQFAESAIQAAVEQMDLSPEALEESLRRRNVEWELLPPNIQELLQFSGDESWADDAVILETMQLDVLELNRRWDRRIQEGDAAKVALTEANLRLVVSVAKTLAICDVT